MKKKTEEVAVEVTTVAPEVTTVAPEVTDLAITEDASEFDVMNLDSFDISGLGFSEEELKALTGLNNIKSTDISIPYATLAMKDTTTLAKGDLLIPGAETIKGWTENEELTGVSILNIQPVRVYFPSPYKATNSFICRSLDGEYGSQDGEYAGQKCATCEFSKYPADGGASPCRDQRLLLLATDQGVFQFVVSGIGMKEFRNFLTQQVMTVLPKVNGIFPALRFDVSIGRVETDNGPFPYMNFKLAKQPLNNKKRVTELLSTVKGYLEFADEHASSAATATQVEDAISNREEASGPNQDVF